ncbi:hypothetical protein FRB97_009514 [Tulasnella sp. 331]|nr:hypothetical protein FRB97_009514 [Tulasnella sp. 331]
MAHSNIYTSKRAAGINGRLPTVGITNPRQYNARLIASSKPKEDGMFVYKRGGRKHHALPMSECPYPLACDREALDLDILDGNHMFVLKGTHTLIDFKDRKTPEKVLDLGCGNGVWIMNMAKDWPECHFTGFDIAPLHPNLRDVDEALESRVDWVYGNFLTAPLPFPDESFDFVHIKEIAHGVPEDKWDQIFLEAARILRPAGALEVIEEGTVEMQSSGRERKPRTPQNPANTASAAQSPSAEHCSGHAKSPLEKSSPHSRPRSSSAAVYMSNPHGSGPSSHSKSASQDHFSSSSTKSPGWNSTTSSGRSSSHNLGRTPLSQSWSNNDAPPVPLPDSRAFVHTTTLPVASASDEHAQLQRLFEKVFERRFINMQPTSLIPNLLNIHFKRSTASPYLIRYMPPPRRKRRQRRSYEKTITEEELPASPDAVRTAGTSGGSAGSPSTNSQPASTRSRSSDAELLAARAKEFYGAREIEAAREAGSRRVGKPSEGPTMIEGLHGDSNEEGDDPVNERPRSSEERNARRVKELLATQMGVALHLHRSLRGILACKEAMWDEFMLSRGWKPADFDNPRKANAIRQERIDFDALMERAAQSRISLDEAINRGLKWTPPAKDSDKLVKDYRELLGDQALFDQDDSNDEEDGGGYISFEGESEVGGSDAVGSLDSDDERITGKPFRRIRAFFDELYELADGSFNSYGMSLTGFLRKAKQFISHLETHHSIEEQYIFPILAKKLLAFKPDAKHIDSHHQIHQGLDQLNALLESIRATPSSYSPTTFRETLDSFRTVLFTHLDQEVRDLGADEFRKHFTLEEMSEIPM